MEKKAYELLLGAEKSWWYKGRAYAISSVLNALYKNPSGAVLDMGAGYGALYPVLKKFGPVTAFEPNEEVGKACLSRGYERLVVSEHELYAMKEYFSLIGMFDVLEHIKDDEAAVRSLAACLRPGGALIATVPAHSWMWSGHDAEHHHQRRYSRAELKRLFERCGFTVRCLSYWNATLFLPAALMRIAGIGGGGTLRPPGFINTIISFILRVESRLFPHFSLPFGASLIIFAEKKK